MKENNKKEKIISEDPLGAAITFTTKQGIEYDISLDLVEDESKRDNKWNGVFLYYNRNLIGRIEACAKTLFYEAEKLINIFIKLKSIKKNWGN